MTAQTIGDGWQKVVALIEFARGGRFEIWRMC
jgi:hypothetical protein